MIIRRISKENGLFPRFALFGRFFFQKHEDNMGQVQVVGTRYDLDDYLAAFDSINIDDEP